MAQELVTWLVAGVLIVGFAALVALVIVQRRRARWLAALPDRPTLDDVLPLGYHRGTCVAALRHLEAERAAGNLDYYRQPFGERAWNVWIPARLAPETGGRRMYLGDWVSAWIRGTLPNGGAA